MDIDHSYLDYQNIKKKQKEIEESEQQEEIEVNFKQPVLKRIKLPDLKDVNLKLLRRKRFFAHCLPIDLNQTQQDPMNRFEKTPLRLRSDPSTYLLSQKSAISNLKSLNSRNQNSQNTQRIDNLRLRQDSSSRKSKLNYRHQNQKNQDQIVAVKLTQEDLQHQLQFCLNIETPKA
eukprot:403369072